MRKVLRRIIVLCMACMICMSGLCMAKFIKDDDGNWVEFYREDEKPWNIYYVDTNAIKVCEYEGKKYLDVSIRRKENTVENYVYYIHQTEVTNAKFHRLLDLENRKKHNIEWQNKYAKQKRGTADISEIKNGKSFTPWDEKLVTWVEQNYPAVINEIRTFNQSGQPATPTPNTNVMGAAKATGDITPPEYTITESGAVKYEMRSALHESVRAWVSPGGPYYIFRMPETLKTKWAGDYVIGYWHYPHETFVRHVGDTWEYADKEYDAEEEEQNKELRSYAQFSYDPKTDMFTFYGDDFYLFRLRLIDRNTVYAELLEFEEVSEHSTPRLTQDSLSKNLSADYTAVFRYVPLSSLTAKEMEIVDNNGGVIADMNDCIWFRDHPCELTGNPAMARQNLFNAYVDMMLAFQAVNGQIGEAPEGYEIAGV